MMNGRQPRHAGSNEKPRERGGDLENPKLEADPPDNMEKDPEDWVSGDDPMTGAQASYLKTLSEQAGAGDAYDERLSKVEASKRIDTLKQELGLE